MGPTPPGTGVIEEAFSFADSKSTSPQSFPLILCIPTSITTAPSGIWSPEINFGTPTATIITSASESL